MKRTVHRVTLLAFALGAAAAPSCGNRVVPPSVDPDAAGQRAVADYDANGDGLLDAKELEKSPALRRALKSVDKNNDQRLSASEIAERIRLFQGTRIGLMTVRGQATLDGAPLAGATVRLVPEKFLGPSFKPSAGLTDAHGYADFRAEGTELPGVAPGFYRVEVSKKDAAGQELVPARFNSQTVVGQEVSPDARGGLTFRLTR